MEENKIQTKEIEDILKSRNVSEIRELFDTHNIVDLAELVGELDIRDAVFVFKILSKRKASDLFTYLEQEKQEKLVEIMTSSEITNIMEDVYSDDIADFLDELPSDLAKKILAAVPAERRHEINTLLSYKDNSCGSIMSTDYVELPLSLTVEEAMEEVRKQRTVAESISFGYIIASDKLVGVIPLRSLLLSPDHAKLEDVMDAKPVRVRTNDDREEAIEAMKNYDLTMIPVVDEEDDLVGVITADDVVDVIEQEATEDIHKMNAIVPVQTGYLETSAFKLALSCLPWLLVLMFYDAISENVINSNDTIVAAFPILSAFIPMLMGTAGNAGSQASSMVIRGIIVDKMDIKSIGTVVWKELRVALLCGLILFVVNFGKIMLFSSGATPAIAFIASITLFLVVVLGKLIGGCLPLLAEAIHLDPAVMASPLVTSICDLISLTVYFALARALL